MPDITEIEQWFKDNNIDIKDIRNIKLLMQENNDLLRGGLRSNNIRNFRTIDTFNAQDSLDATYPMYMHLNISEDMTKIVSIKLSFWLLPFRAYDKSAASGGGSTTPSGGGATSGSGGGQTSSSGGGQTSSAANTYLSVPLAYAWTAHAPGYVATSITQTSLPKNDHTHTVNNHTHTVANHTHTTPNHTHTTPDHEHSISFGIYEETNSPTIGFQISRDNGATYGDILGKYTTDVINLEIKDYIAASGSYIIKFTSSARARLSSQVTLKLDITAR